MVGLEPRVTIRNPRVTPRKSSWSPSVASPTYPDPTNPTSNPHWASTGQHSTQRGYREAMHGHQQPSEAPQRLDRAVTLALTLGTGAVHGDAPTYSRGKNRPSWARRVSFLAPERVAHLPLPLHGCHQPPENGSYWYDLDHSSMIVWG